LISAGLLAAVAAVVGLFIGTVGVGGVLLIRSWCCSAASTSMRGGDRAVHVPLHRPAGQLSVSAARLDQLASHAAGLRGRAVFAMSGARRPPASSRTRSPR